MVGDNSHASTLLGDLYHLCVLNSDVATREDVPVEEYTYETTRGFGMSANISALSATGKQLAENDETMLVAAAQVDPAAFAELHRLYEIRVSRYLRARTDNDEDAADLTQQVFLQALDALPRYRDRKVPFAAWLFRIARNVAIDFHRRQRLTVTLDSLPEALYPGSSQDPEMLAIRHETFDKLRRLLAALDPAKRELLALYFGAGLSQMEIASVVGSSSSTVQRNLRGILNTLKEQYDEE